MTPDQTQEPTNVPAPTPGPDQNALPSAVPYQPTVIQPQTDGTLFVSHADTQPVPSTAMPQSNNPQPAPAPVQAQPVPIAQTPIVPPVTPAAQPAPQPPVQTLNGFGQPFVGQPFAAPAPTATNGQSYPPFDPLKLPKTRSKKKFLFAGMGLALVLAILGGGYTFAFYIPNQPQNVWKTGLDRSGKAVDALVSQGTEKQTLEAFKKSEVNITGTATVDKASYGGQLNLKYDGANAAGDVSVTAKQEGQVDKVFATKFLSQFKSGAQYPNIYLQFTGLKSFGLDTYMPGLVQYESKWIGIEESYLKTLGITPQEAKDAKDKQITSDDVAEVIRTASSVSSEYLLTSNPQKAVFEQRQFVGKEKIDGKTTYHYVVGVNKQHAKDYCAALIDKMTQTQVYKKYSTGAVSDSKDSLTKDCQKSIDDDLKDTDSFDMWVDGKYKLIYKIRLSDDTDKNIYTEFGQNYSGGDDLSFFVNYHDGTGKSDSKFTMSTNLKSHISKASLAFTGQGEPSYDVKVSLEAKPYSGEIKTDKPAGTVSIEEVLKALGVDPSAYTDTSSSSTTGSSSVVTKANDTERTNDIKMIHSQLEAYYAQKGYYPSLADLNDAKWVQANLRGIDMEALKDPDGSSSTLATSPAAKVYAYQATTNAGKTCGSAKDDCAAYTLAATLSTGSTFVKQSLN